MVDIRPISKEWIEFLNLKKTELNFSYNVSKRATTKPYHRQPLSFTGIKLGSVTEKGERDQNGRSGEKQVHCPLRYWTPFIHCNNKPFGKKDHQHPRTYNVTVCCEQFLNQTFSVE